MKNKVLLFVAISLTTVGFIGLSSILMSEATQNDLYGNVYFKSLYLNNNQEFIISSNSSIKESIMIRYDGNIEDSIECKIDLIE